jgi:hypothetical protein
VTDLSAQWEVILGEEWLRANRATMNFGSRTVALEGQSVVLLPDEFNTPQAAKPVIKVLSCLQAKKAVRKAADVFLAMVIM